MQESNGTSPSRTGVPDGSPPAPDPQLGDTDEARQPREPAAESMSEGPVRPSRPPLSVGGTPPSLQPPEPPRSLRIAGSAWRLTALGLGVALGLTCLALSKGRTRLRELVVEQAPGASEHMVKLATNIVLIGGLVLWAVLAIGAVVLSKRVQRPRVTARLVGLLAWLALLGSLLLTAVPLTDDHGLGLVARLMLGLAAGAATCAAIMGVLPNAWRWVREVTDRSGRHPGSGSRPAPAMPPTDR